MALDKIWNDKSDDYSVGSLAPLPVGYQSPQDQIFPLDGVQSAGVKS